MEGSPILDAEGNQGMQETCKVGHMDRQRCKVGHNGLAT